MRGGQRLHGTPNAVPAQMKNVSGEGVYSMSQETGKRSQWGKQEATLANPQVQPQHKIEYI